MIASKLGLFLVGGGLIGTSVTGIYLVNKNSAPAIALQEQRDHSNSTKLTSIVCTNEDGVLEELGIVEGANIDDSLKQLINEELKKDKDKCLTSQDHSFNYY